MPKFISYADAIIAVDQIAYIAPSADDGAIVITLKDEYSISILVGKADIARELKRIYSLLTCPASTPNA